MNKSLIFVVPLVLSFAHALSQSITQDTVRIQEVVVTGSRVEVARKNVPMTVDIITREEIEYSNESALLPLISERIPGLFVTERGVTGFGVADGAAGQINIRGIGGNPTTQVLILIDGHPQFMGMMGHHLPDAYVASDAEKVEVIRGPSSILYGSNAYGGVINIITRKQKKDGFTANGRVLYGSFNTQKYMGSLGYKRNRLSLFGSVNHDRTDGHRDSSDFHITNGYLKAVYAFSDRIRLITDYSIAKYASADPGPESGLSGNRIDILRGKTALSIENHYNQVEGALKIYYNYGEHNISDGWNSHDEMYGLMVYQGLKLFPGNTLTLGYDYMQFGGKGSPITTVLRDEEGNIIPGPQGPQFVLSEFNDRWTTMNSNGFYGFSQQNVFQELVLTAGLRYEINRSYGNEWIPQIGFACHFSSTTNFRGSLSKGYRPPSIRELFLFPPANDELVPERMWNYELGWSQQWLKGRMKTELTGFISDGDNVIIKVPSAPPPPPQYKNSGSFNNKGIEVSWDYTPTYKLKLHANYTFIHMREPLPGTPQQNLFVSGKYHFRKFSFYLKMQNIFDLFNENDQGLVEVIEKGYTLLGVRVGYQVTKFFEAFITAENLFNQKYQINYGYPMPGITFFGGVNLKINGSESRP